MADEQNQQPPDYAGYPSLEELIKGYRASGEEAKRLAREYNQYKQESEARWNALNARPDVPQRQRPEDRLAEFGIPTDAMDQFVNERLAQALAPLARGMEARNQVLREYPDYNKFEADVAQFIESDPDLRVRYPKLFAADPAAAMEFALLRFGERKRRESPTATQPTSADTTHAQLPDARSGDARKMGETNSQDVEDAWEKYRKTGSREDAEKYAHARLHNVIKEDFLRQ